jgi:hypothetical protein
MRRVRLRLLLVETQVLPMHHLAEMRLSTCSRLLHRPVRTAAVLEAVAARGPLGVVLQVLVLVRSMLTVSSFCATTLSSSSYDRLYNSSRKCLSPSSSRSVQETHSWRR